MARVHPFTDLRTMLFQEALDQAYQIPPPENAQRYTHQKTRWCRCCYYLGFIFIYVALLVFMATVLFYVIVRPVEPNYTIDSISIKRMNFTSSLSSTISPEVDIVVRSDNGNNEIGIYYLMNSTVEMLYKDVVLCNGTLPVFYQPLKNVTVFETVLKGNGVELAGLERMELVNAVAKRNAPLMLKLRVPVKIEVRSVKSRKFTVKVNCDVSVDQLTVGARIVSSKYCSYGLDFWR